MTDHAESKLREWALKRNGDPIDNHDVVELIFAMDEDNSARHEESMSLLAEHCDEAQIRDRRIADLEAWRTASVTACPALIADTVHPMIEQLDAEHLAFHNAHLLVEHAPHREDDPPGSDFLERRDEGDAVIVKSRRFTPEQIVASVIIFLAVMLTQTAVTYFIVLYLDQRYR